MPEVNGTEFLKSTSRTEPETRPFKIADNENRYIEVTLHPIERKDLFDELNRLPGGFIDMMMSGDDVEGLEDVEDPDDVDVDVAGGDLLTQLDGDTIDVFETIFYKSATHPDLTGMDMEEIAPKLGFEVLFEVGGEVIDMSLERPDEIKAFREPDSDKSS